MQYDAHESMEHAYVDLPYANKDFILWYYELEHNVMNLDTKKNKLH